MVGSGHSFSQLEETSPNKAFNMDSVMLSPFLQRNAKKLPTLLRQLTQRSIANETWR